MVRMGVMVVMGKNWRLRLFITSYGLFSRLFHSLHFLCILWTTCICVCVLMDVMAAKLATRNYYQKKSII